MEGTQVFHDRKEAGQCLAEALGQYKNAPNTIVLALPRGGVPVAYEVAKQLQLPWDVFLVRKLGVPYHKELAMGAIASGGVTYLNTKVISELGIKQQDIDKTISEEESVLKWRESHYREGRSFPKIEDRTVILVDDGIATGSTIQAAIRALKKLSPQKIIIAVPVAPISTVSEIKLLVDDMVCLNPAQVFSGVSMFYKNFSQTTDEEVCSFLNHEESTRE